MLYTPTGALGFVVRVTRVTVTSRQETPKYLLGEGKDAQLCPGFQKHSF
jgi:hypothetical protein